MNRAENFTRIVTRAAQWGAALSFATLIAAVLIQVAGRMAGSSPVWTEEMTRFALLFLVAFGTGLAFRSGDLVNVDAVCEALPGRWPWALRLLSSVVTGALALYLLPHAWRYVAIGKAQTSPALGARMDYVHAAVWLMLALVAVFALIRVLGMLSGSSDGKPIKQHEEA